MRISTVRLFYFCIITGSTLLGQQSGDIDKQIKYQSVELNKIRQEIERFESRISETKKEEQSMLNQLNQLDEEISLNQRLIQQLNKEQMLKESRIKTLEQNITNRSESLRKLKKRFADRLRKISKQGSYLDWELLLTSQSLNQAAYRYKYLRIVSDYDEKTANEIRDQITHINRQKDQLLADIQAKKKIIQEKDQAVRSLGQKKSDRKKMLARVRQDRQSLERDLKEKEAAAKKVEAMIASLEREKERRAAELARRRSLEGISVDNRFLNAKGSLIWPAQGRVISKFGYHTHPVLKTQTNNPGIDIKATKGSNVKVVMDGVITTITWMRGYGNTIIVDHGDGYYTIYTHVDDVKIEKDQYVSQGQVIARVGDSGSLDGAKLHFEIWGEKTPLNPESWLAKL